MNFTPLGLPNAEGPLTRTTSAPLLRAALPMAYPIFPDDLFDINLTGSRYSLVGPAVTRIFSFTRSFRLREDFTASIISGISDILPIPSSPHARLPFSGPTWITPRDKRHFKFSWKKGFSYILQFIEGARTTLPANERRQVVRRLSAIPLANFPMVFAVAGATTMMSAWAGKVIWIIGSPKRSE